MEHLLLIIIGILLLIVFVLLAKVWFLRKSAQEISEAFRDRLAADTNTLIDISTRDPYMRKLAADINTQLRLLRKERHRYQQGDLELKEAVTNISHDLRTPLTAINGYLDLLEREEKSETVQRYLSQIQNRTAVLKNLTEELFRYSVVTSSQDLKPERMDVVRALEESLLSFYAVMQEKGIQPEIELPEEPVYRELDAGAVNRQVAALQAARCRQNRLRAFVHADKAAAQRGISARTVRTAKQSLGNKLVSERSGTQWLLSLKTE